MATIVMIVDLFIIFLSYNITYESTVKSSESLIIRAGDIAKQYFANREFRSLDSDGGLSLDFSYLCGLFDVTYVFAVEVDVDKNSETYLAIGFGDDATDEAKKTRYAGITVVGSMTDEELEALKGEKEYVISHEKSTFGESLICYYPCFEHYNYKTDKYEKLDKPIIVGAEISLTAITRSVQSRFRMIAVLTVSLTLFIFGVFALIMYFRVTRPIRKIGTRMSSFVTDREKEKTIEKLEIKGHDEFSLMADSFNSMTEEIDRYIDDIDALNREKHTQEAELNIARRIQNGLLQPDHTQGESFDIRAYMLPAKDVGGDLYDYRLLDGGRIFVAIADVSGKGISAALFMSRAITLLHQYAVTDYTPSQILYEFNNTLAAQNPGGMFITTFLAFYDPATGLLTYSNAGHNFPYILSDKAVPLEDGHGTAAGLFENEIYQDAVIPFPAGGTLFLYTDGVNEARNRDGDFYGDERLCTLLSRCLRANSTDPLHAVLDDLNSFTDGAEQSDDITMLSLRISAAFHDTVLHLRSVPEELLAIREVIQGLSVSDELKRLLRLASEEVFVNICSYAYDTPSDVEVTIREGDRVEMIFRDGGKPFDPTANLLNIEEYDHEHAVGGLGRFLTFRCADGYHYEYRGGMNVLELYFKDKTDPCASGD